MAVNRGSVSVNMSAFLSPPLLCGLSLLQQETGLILNLSKEPPVAPFFQNSSSQDHVYFIVQKSVRNKIFHPPSPPLPFVFYGIATKNRKTEFFLINWKFFIMMNLQLV